MAKPLNSLAGIWLGANTLALPVACLLLYMMTGKLPVPVKKSIQLLDIQETEAYIRELADVVLEGGHE